MLIFRGKLGKRDCPRILPSVRGHFLFNPSLSLNEKPVQYKKIA